MEEDKFSKKLYYFLKFLTKGIFTFLFNIKNEDDEIKHLKPPYLLLANHSNWWDPYIISINNKYPISFVATEDIFRLFPYNLFMDRVGAIPKLKFIPDSDTVKYILRAKKKKRIIGIFPEGERNWDGKTIKLVPSTFKLIKSLKIPVVVSKLKGAHLSYPRWTKSYRRGEITITNKLLFTKDDLNKYSLDEIGERLSEELRYNDYEYNKTRKIRFKGLGKANGLKNLLFICPECHSISKLIPKGNDFLCTECLYRVTINNYGFLEISKKAKMEYHLHFDNIQKWHDWEKKHFQSYINKVMDEYGKYRKKTDSILFTEKGIKLFIRQKAGKIKKILLGDMFLYKDKIIIRNGNTNSTKDIYKYNISKIIGINVLYRDLIDFSYNEKLHRIALRKNGCALKWVYAIRFMKNYNKNNQLEKEENLNVTSKYND